MPVVTHLTFVRPATFTYEGKSQMKEHFPVESPDLTSGRVGTFT
jgi:hypothetical protein